LAPPVKHHDYHLLVRVLRPGSAAHRARMVVRHVLENAGVHGAEVGGLGHDSPNHPAATVSAVAMSELTIPIRTSCTRVPLA
jgi:hypothetical protein